MVASERQDHRPLASRLLLVVSLLNEEEQALARGLTTGIFDRSDAVRQRDKHREVTKTLLTWLVRRQTFERSPAW